MNDKVHRSNHGIANTGSPPNDRPRRARPLTTGLAFAAEGFCRDLAIAKTPGLHELLYARSRIVVAPRANGIPSVLDLVHTTIRKDDADGRGAWVLDGQMVDAPAVERARQLLARAER